MSLFINFILCSLFIVDFVSKKWALSLTKPIVITPFLSFEFALNRGISWGCFSSGSLLAFFAISCAVIGFLFYLLNHIFYRKKQGHTVTPEAVVLVGGVANFIDRIQYGGVVDFIHFAYGSWSFPIFNIADICIVLGSFFLFYKLWQEAK